MTYIIKSAKLNKSMTTKDPLKDEAWGNEYYGTDDCVRVEVAEPTQAEMEKQERICQLMFEIKHLEEGYNYSKMSGDMYNETLSWADKKLVDWRSLKQELDRLKNS